MAVNRSTAAGLRRREAMAPRLGERTTRCGLEPGEGSARKDWVIVTWLRVGVRTASQRRSSRLVHGPAGSWGRVGWTTSEALRGLGRTQAPALYMTPGSKSGTQTPSCLRRQPLFDIVSEQRAPRS